MGEGMPKMNSDEKYPANEALADFVDKEQRHKEEKELDATEERERARSQSLETIESEVRAPQMGERIYVPPADSHLGGFSTISEVTRGISGGREVYKVRVADIPRTLYTWEALFANQAYLKENFGHQRATITDEYAP